MKKRFGILKFQFGEFLDPTCLVKCVRKNGEFLGLMVKRVLQFQCIDLVFKTRPNKSAWLYLGAVVSNLQGFVMDEKLKLSSFNLDWFRPLTTKSSHVIFGS